MAGLNVAMLRVNELSGDLPDDVFHSMQHVKQFNVRTNSLEGSLPEVGMCHMTSVRSFAVNTNKLTGILPAHGLASMSLVALFVAYDNFLHGALPPDGLRTLSLLRDFGLQQNGIEGTLPGDAMQGMALLKKLLLQNNQITGSLPEDGLRRTTWLESLVLSSNLLVGTVPSIGLSRLSALQMLAVGENEIRGALPETGLSSTRRLESLWFKDAQFASTLPEPGLMALSNLQVLNGHNNTLAGALPDDGTSALYSLRAVMLSFNALVGQLPEQGLLGKAWLIHVALHKNKLSGSLPDHGMKGLAGLTDSLLLTNNQFTGPCPERGLAGMSFVQQVWIGRNRLTGSLPGFGIWGMSSMVIFSVNDNAMQGKLPGRGLSKASHLRCLVLQYNAFSGTLPSGGLKHMLDVQEFRIKSNMFDGTLPEKRFRAMSFLDVLWISQNRFSGALPDRALRSMSYMRALLVDRNNLEGLLPSSLGTSPSLQALLLGGTHLEGRLQSSLGVCQSDLSIVSLHGLRIEGSIPDSLGRMNGIDITLVAGLSIMGQLPTVSGTFLHLIAFGTALEGPLPRMRLDMNSRIVLHGNLLSCHLPRSGEVKPFFSLALLGNSFSEPRNGAYPPWVHNSEQGDFFCVTDRHFLQWLVMTLCDVSIFAVAYLRSFRRHRPLSHSGILIRGAFEATLRLLANFFVIMSIVACGYLQVRSFYCQTLLSRWEFPVRGAGEPLVLVVQLAWLFVFVSVGKLFVHYHQAHTVPSRPKSHKRSRRKKSIGISNSMEVLRNRMAGATRALVWLTWIALCFVVSGPSSLYAMVKAVPGFIQTSKALSWCLNTLVASITSLLTVFLLPRFAAYAARLANAPSRVELLGISKLLATFLLSGLVTLNFHEHCFGWWTRFWLPCRHSSASGTLNIAMIERVRIAFMNNPFGEQHSTEEVLRKADLCEHHRDVRLNRCAQALVNRSDRTLLATLSNLGLTAPALLLYTGKRMDMQDACVLLGFMWEVSILLGPGSPVVLIPLLVIALVHGFLLLGRINILRDEKEEDASIPRRAAAVASLLTVLFEFALCYRDSTIFFTLLVSCIGLGCWRCRKAGSLLITTCRGSGLVVAHEGG